LQNAQEKEGERCRSCRRINKWLRTNKDLEWDEIRNYCDCDYVRDFFGNRISQRAFLENYYSNDEDIIIEWYNYGRFDNNKIWSYDTFKQKYNTFNYNELKFIYSDAINMKNNDIIDFYIKKYEEYKSVNFLNYIKSNENDIGIFIFDEFIKFQPMFTDKNYKMLLLKLNKENKINTLILSIADFKKKYPLFNIDFYKNFNKIILSNYDENENENEYIYNWYTKDKNNDNILYCDEMFYKLYPEFNLNIFNFFNEKKDIFYFYNLKDKSKIIYSIESFKNNSSDFNYNFYKDFFNLNNLTDE
jgi:hypothetical protein